MVTACMVRGRSRAVRRLVMRARRRADRPRCCGAGFWVRWMPPGTIATGGASFNRGFGFKLARIARGCRALIICISAD
eukprot:30279-Pelagococcus_subviridis.AAC.1